MKVLKKVAGFVLGAVGAVVGFIAGGPVGAAIGFSVGMGIGSAAQMMAMKTKVPDVSSATQQRLNVSMDPDAHRKIAFGETALGTDQVYWETWGPENSYYDQVIAAAGHQIESFGKLYFDDEEVTFSGDNATGAYAGAVFKDDRTIGQRGSALQAGAGTLWNANATLTGCAHYALKFRWSQEKFPRGIPSRITRVGKGARVYDPRRDSTRGGSGSHRADVQSTWEYAPIDSNGQPIGRNPALQILWYEMGYRALNPDTGEWILTCGRGRPLDDIDFASFITAANECEEQEYYSDVLLSTGDAHATNIAVLEAACAGKVMDTGGLISLRIRTDTTGDIVQAFTDADIIDTEAGVWRPSLPLSERWNQGRGSFVDPRALYRITPLPEPVRDATYEAEDGWKRPGPEFRFDAVQDPEQAQKLIRLELNISRYMGVFTAPFNWRAKKVRIWDIVTLTSSNDGFEDKLFRVLEKKTDPMGAIWLLLREDDPSIYSGGTVNPVPAPSPGAGYDPRIVTSPDAGDWAVTPVYVEGGGAKFPALRIVGSEVAPNIVAVRISYRPDGDANWAYLGRFPTNPVVRTGIASVAPDTDYYIRLVYENAYGAVSGPTDLGPFTSLPDFSAGSAALADAIVGQGWGATASESAASNAWVPKGENLLVNGNFSLAQIGWLNSGGAVSNRVVTGDAANAYIGDSYLQTPAPDVASDTLNSVQIAVAPGEFFRLAAVVRRSVAGSTGSVQARLRFINAAGDLVSAAGPTWTTEDTYTIKSQIIVVPAGAVQAQITFLKNATTGGRRWNCGLFFIERLTQTGTNLIDSAGNILGDAAVITAAGVASAIAGQGVLATADQVTWATQVTGTGKPEDFANLSRVFRQDSAPSSPNTNDIWVQTSSGNPIAVRAWNGTAWVTGADITLINTAAAILGQGWGATASEAAASNALLPKGTNLAVNGTFAEGQTGWTTAAGVVTTDAANAYIGDKYFYTTNTTSNTRSINSFVVPVIPGEFMRTAAAVKRMVAGSGGSVEVRRRFVNAAGDAVAVQTLSWTTEDTYTLKSNIAVVPAGAVLCDIDIHLTSPAGGRRWAVGLVFVERLTKSGENLIDSAGNVLGDAAIITASGTAAAILGQGVWATGNYYQQTSDPGSAPNGSILYRTDTKQLKIRASGSWVVVGTNTDAPISATHSGSYVHVAIGTGTRNTGSITINPTGGSGGYTYSHELVVTDNPNSLSPVLNSPTSQTFSVSHSSQSPTKYVRFLVISTVTDSAGASFQYVRGGILGWES